MLNTIMTKSFWVAAVERALKTFAQVILALFANDQVNILTVDWSAGLVVAGTAVLISFLTSILSVPAGPDGSPSLVPYEPHKTRSEPAV